MGRGRCEALIGSIDIAPAELARNPRCRERRSCLASGRSNSGSAGDYAIAMCAALRKLTADRRSA